MHDKRVLIFHYKNVIIRAVSLLGNDKTEVIINDLTERSAPEESE